jgi:hypothetical protein
MTELVMLNGGWRETIRTTNVDCERLEVDP